MTTKIDIKRWDNKKVIFSHTCENNTLKKTLEQAVKDNADLENADLRNSNLQDANLRNSNLDNADLENANLRNSNLENADLRNSYLENADLQNANLRNSKLQGAYLPMFCKWRITVKDDKIIIGCKSKTIKQWDAFFDSNLVFETPRNTPEFFRIKAVYLAHKIYIETLNNFEL